MALIRNSEFQFAVSPEKRIIWFSGEICAESSRRIINSLRRLNKTREGPICFYLSGRGGDFKYCFAIGNEIQNSSNPVAGIAHGQVISACFMLTQFFKVCLGVEGTIFGFHRTARESRITKGLIMNQDFLQRELDRLKMMDAIQVSVFYRRLRDFDRLFDFLRNDKVIEVSEAIKLGLIDDYFDRGEFGVDRRFMRGILKKN